MMMASVAGNKRLVADAARQSRFHQLAVVSIVLPLLAITVTIAIAMEKAAAMTILQPSVNFVILIVFRIC